jgi:hypothetical protein
MHPHTGQDSLNDAENVRTENATRSNAVKAENGVKLLVTTHSPTSPPSHFPITTTLLTNLILLPSFRDQLHLSLRQRTKCKNKQIKEMLNACKPDFVQTSIFLQ